MKVAIIPARGGSKRIPDKNIRDFLGKPIIAYSIEAALDTGLFDDVIVSTDDTEIAEIAKKWGASVPFMRPEAIADDHAPIISTPSHVDAETQLVQGARGGLVVARPGHHPGVDELHVAGGLVGAEPDVQVVVFS